MKKFSQSKVIFKQFTKSVNAAKKKSIRNFVSSSINTKVIRNFVFSTNAKTIRNRVVSLSTMNSKNIYQQQSNVNQQNANQLSKFLTKKSKMYTNIKFEIKNEFIYNLIESRRRLCISTACETEVFRMTHDENQHVDRHRFYQRIVDVFYVFRLFKKLRLYFEHCSKLSKYK